MCSRPKKRRGAGKRKSGRNKPRVKGDWRSEVLNGDPLEGVLPHVSRRILGEGSLGGGGKCRGGEKRGKRTSYWIE